MNRRRMRVIIQNFQEKLGRWVLKTWREAKARGKQ